ncbi:MAG: hypothetical protein HKN81_05755 [Gammaproteobacteria bacterium]|nr:hypothetical protein [Gammaproteobacteria bacterium]
MQSILADTDMQGEVTLFDNMPDYRHSKPRVDPLTNYQAVTYRGQMPIMVSCKIKGAAHIRSAFGDDAAGEQQYCPAVTRMTVAQAAAELETAGDAAAAAKARTFVVDDNEPFMTGRDYLADFELSYVGDDEKVHLQSPGLFHDYDSWTTIILPENFEGQTYCHLATVAYVKALATGELEPGTKMTTADDAPVQPY